LYRDVLNWNKRIDSKMLQAYDTVEEFWNAEDIEMAINSASMDSLDLFRQDFASSLNTNASHVSFTPSGRSALSSILKAIPDSRTLVAMPAFTCPAVVDTVRDAGKKPVFLDFAPSPGQMLWKTVADKLNAAFAAVIVTHYFGVPSDFSELVHSATQYNVPIIEDCAHCLGGAIGHRKAGTIGDASFFSFSTDKPLSLGYGGALIVNNRRLASCISKNDSIRPSMKRQKRFFRMLLSDLQIRRSTLFSRRSLKTRIADRIRSIRVKELNVQNTFSIGNIQAELGRISLKRYEECAQTREANARSIDDVIVNETWPISSQVQPKRIRQKVRTRDSADAEKLIRKLQSIGFRAGLLNWHPHSARCDLTEYPKSAEVFKHWVDIPIHQNIRPQDFDRLITLLNVHFHEPE
jgi:dTDP-4-amino-4,6-dideoxygalactose transaminase